jgi:hypothetical protein
MSRVPVRNSAPLKTPSSDFWARIRKFTTSCCETLPLSDPVALRIVQTTVSASTFGILLVMMRRMSSSVKRRFFLGIEGSFDVNSVCIPARGGAHGRAHACARGGKSQTRPATILPNGCLVGKDCPLENPVLPWRVGAANGASLGLKERRTPFKKVGGNAPPLRSPHLRV